jgi:glycosyltransferase involved in cell wall biosynthesis
MPRQSWSRTVPRVSVILPVYNGAAFVAEAVDSVLAQTLTDWELIVVDDGSTDQTPAILARYTDPRITVAHQANQGAAAARNAALERATGCYVGFLDADDLYLPDGLQLLTRFLERHAEYDVVFSDGTIFDADGKPLQTLSELRPRIYTGDILEPLVLSADVITFPVCTLTRRSAIEANAIRFDPALRTSEDWDFWIQLAGHVHFGYLDARTCWYRVHAGNITSSIGASVRRSDLVRNRRKISLEPWFGYLSLPTREAFFHNLLVGLLPGQRESQEEFCASQAFLDLPARSRGRLLRLAATDCLQRGDEPGVAASLLQRSLAVWQGDRKAALLLAVLERAPGLARAMVGAWSRLRKAGAVLRSGGRRPTGRVPTELKL